jgi:hypothetical protein
MSRSPMHRFEEAVSHAAFAAAPDKAEALYSRVRHIKLEFLYEPQLKAGSFRFSANPESRVIEISEGALELLRAASFAFTILSRICRDSQRDGRDRVNAADFPELQQAFRLYGWALNTCDREVCQPWPEESPSSEDGDLQARLATELFLSPSAGYSTA